MLPHLLALGFSAPETTNTAPKFWPKYVGAHSATLLDGAWSYGLHDGVDAAAPNLDVSSADWTPNTTTVPSCIDNVPPGYAGRRTTAIYRTTFEQSSEAMRLWFGACSFYCRVWVDGKEIGEHRAGGYVPFSIDVPPASKSTDARRTLTVLADNRFNKSTAPLHTGGDFWHYGGLMRSVVLHALPARSAVWRAYIYPFADLQHVNVTVVLADKAYSGTYDYTLRWDDGSAPSHAASAVAKDGEFTLVGLAVPSARAWSTTDPQLHTLTVRGAGGGGVTERFGLRSWGVEASANARLTLNGKVLKLHGWNHHTQFPGTAASPTDAQLDADLALLKRGGANYVRGAHYPQDQRWLDRLDEAGVVMWEEALGPGVSLANTQDAAWMALQLTQLDEMLDASLNHAAIMTWGWFNEGPSSQPAACGGYAACSAKVAARDGTRFRTWASSSKLEDKCLDHATLISFNNYPAWYGPSGEKELPIIEPYWAQTAAAARAMQPDKPFVVSETGAGAIWEWSKNTSLAKWTTAYQAAVLSRDVDVALADDNISGLSLWHFYDFKGDDAAQRSCGPCDYLADVAPPTCGYIDVGCYRPGGENHKGVVDFWRRPKQAYALVAAKFNASLRAAAAATAAAAVEGKEAAPEGAAAATTTLWPEVSSRSSGSTSLRVAPSAAFFKLAAGTGASPLLEAAFARYATYTFPHAADAGAAGGRGAACGLAPPTALEISALEIAVASVDESHPQLGTDESYTLDVPAAGGTARGTAKTVYGALRLLETFSQLLSFDFDCGAYALAGAPWAISDAPRFAHRGLMVDTARHYQPLASLRAIVASLPYAKVNVLHWHMADTQSFPFEVRSSPKLWHAAYAPSQRYTQADVAALVEFARLRGVRVIVEFDMPGHAQSWCVGYPELCPSATCTTPLNVASEGTFTRIGDLLRELTGGKSSEPGAPSGLFPDDFVHLGGDEVDTSCWDSTPAVAAWLQQHNLTADGGYAYFVKRAAAFALAQGRRPVQWSEVYDHFKDSLPKQTIVHVWKDVTNVTEVLAGGYSVLRNVGYDKTSWYLDNLDVGFEAVYSNEPCHDVPDALCGGILGGHGEMWGETVDASDLQQTVWPRLAAIAEKLWSPRAKTADAGAAVARVADFRCHLNERGVAAAPVKNANARSSPAGPGSCFDQRRRR